MYSKKVNLENLDARDFKCKYIFLRINSKLIFDLKCEKQVIFQKKTNLTKIKLNG